MFKQVSNKLKSFIAIAPPYKKLKVIELNFRGILVVMFILKIFIKPLRSYSSYCFGKHSVNILGNK